MLVGAIISVVLGIMIWARLPSSALWILGLLLGGNLVFSGGTFLLLSSVRQAPTATAQ